MSIIPSMTSLSTAAEARAQRDAAYAEYRAHRCPETFANYERLADEYARAATAERTAKLLAQYTR